MTQAAIVPAGPPHAALLAELHEGAIAPAWPAASFATLLAQPGVAGWIATQKEEPVGLLLARAAADEAEILTIAVMPARRRQGVAASLMDALMGWCAALNVQRLHLEVATRNEAACALYRKFGFDRVGKRSDYYGPGDHALILSRDIPRPPAPAGSG